MSAPAILLLTDDPVRQAAWAEMLRDGGQQVYRHESETPRAAPIDVIVTDRPLAPESLGERSRAWARGEIGVVAIDSPAPADVFLPADATPRELRLACRLLAEIVRLRRQRRRGTHVRKKLGRLALRDPLTGVGNRRAWDEELAARWSAAKTAGRSLCVALFDVDHFKRINDECGHAAGDAILRSVAERLAAHVRPKDHVARLGGDEFGLLFFDLPATEAAAVVERVRRALSHAGDAQRPFDVTASAGYALQPGAPGERAAPAALVEAADDALRRAKTQGRNRTCGAEA